jgi:hypothetical protein
VLGHRTLVHCGAQLRVGHDIFHGTPFQLEVSARILMY